MLTRYKNIKQNIKKIPLNSSDYIEPKDVRQYLTLLYDLEILINDALNKIKAECRVNNQNAINLFNNIKIKNHQFQIQNSIYNFLKSLKQSYIIKSADDYTQSKQLDKFRFHLLNYIPEFKPLKTDDIYTYFFEEVDKL